MLLDGKKLLITGVLTPQSIAFAAATSAQEQGAEIVLTNFGRTVGLTRRVAKRLPQPAMCSRWTRTTKARSTPCAGSSRRGGGASTGSCTRSRSRRRTRSGGDFLHTPWESVATAFQTSAYSLKAIAVGLLPPHA